MNNLENKRMRFGYEDTDKKIEIDLYGITFEIKNLENLEEMKKMDTENGNVVEAQLEKVLGEGAIERINNKRRKDGREDLTLEIMVNIFGCIFEAYARTISDGMISKVTNTMNEISESTNRETRRNYDRNYNRRGNRNNRGYNNYRRY